MKVTIKGLDNVLKQIKDHQESLLGYPVVFVEDVVPISQKIIDGAFLDKPQTDASWLIESEERTQDMICQALRIPSELLR